MPMIYVRAKQGRVAYDAPRRGKIIPQDRFVPVPDTPFIRRLIDFHGDLEAQAAKPKAPAPAPAPAPERK